MTPSVHSAPTPLQVTSHLPSAPVIQKIFAVLLDLLTGPNPEIRRQALISIARLRGEIAADVVFERYRVDNLEEYLALAVSRLDPERAATVLVEALSDPNPEARLAAATALSQGSREPAVRALSEALDGYLNPSKKAGATDQPLLSEDTLTNAVRALGELGLPMCISQLRKFVLTETNPRVRASATAALGRHITDGMLQMFQNLCKDPDARVRANAVEALSNLDNPSIVVVLQPSLYDSHQRVRANAIKAIWKYGDYEVSDAIKEMLVHPSKAQRVSAVYAIGEIHAKVFLKALVPFLKDPDPDLRRNAIISIRKFGQSEAAKGLNGMLADPESEVRTQAIHALVDLYGSEMRDALLKRLSEEIIPSVRALLVTRLSHMGNPEVLPRILPVLEETEERVLLAGIEAIGRLQPDIPPPTLIQRMRNFLEKGTDRVRMQAVRVLWEWGCDDALKALYVMLIDPAEDRRKRGLICLGELFNAVSAQAGEGQERFQSALKDAADSRRIRLIGERNQIRREEFVESLTRVQASIQAGQFQEAETLLQIVLTDDPNNVNALNMLGDLLFKVGRNLEATKIFESVLKLQPNLVKAHYALGQIHHRNAAWAKASAELFATVKLHPKLPQAWLLLGDTFERQQRFVEAIAAYKRLQPLVPQNSGVMAKLARVLFCERHIGEAISWANQASALGAQDPGTTLISATGDLLSDRSEDALRRVLRLFRTVLEKPDSTTAAELRPLIAIAQELAVKKGQK
ncbi:MAG: HEAT repeat domain-containing protein [Candidatus Ozemobacteraceae bacterium]